MARAAGRSSCQRLEGLGDRPSTEWNPVNITTGTDNNLDGYNNDRPNLVPGANPFLDPHRPRPVAAAAWFNKAAFTPNGPGLSGGIGPGGADGNTPRDFLRSPGYRDIDMSLQREFRIREGMAFQFKADSTNVFNLVSLNAPNATLSSPHYGVRSPQAARSARRKTISQSCIKITSPQASGARSQYQSPGFDHC
jgi:hypothetical protein